jgi:cathepsin A (carboxypeptidase C)
MARVLRLGALVACAAVASAVKLTTEPWTSPANEGWEFTGTLDGNPVEGGLCDPDVKSESGYFRIDGSKNLNYFYWYLESRSSPSTDPLVVWLTGGPGCSSVLALLVENGPCSVKPDASGTTLNPYSWTSNANVMWIDQPAGVGYSYGDKADYINNEDEVAEDLYQFLQAFLSSHESLQGREFFIFGESYGGHFVPATAFRIFQGNQQQKQGTLHVNLAGVGVGNGLTDPEIQYAYYGQMAYNNSYGIEAVDQATFNQMQAAVPKCTNLIHKCQANDAFCAPAQVYCNEAIVAKYQPSGLNVYDIRIPCGSSPLCYDFSNVDKWLNTPEVMQALHVSKDVSEWQECNMKVNSDFKGDWMKNYQERLPPMLEAGIPVLIYAGDCDFICNWLGNKAWALSLDWAGKDGFVAADDAAWLVGGEEKGKVRSSGPFTFLQVYQAGHMVPMDQPAASLAMLNTFLAHQPF